MLTPIWVEFGFFPVEFQALNTLHFYDINIFCLGDFLSFFKRQPLLIIYYYEKKYYICIKYLLILKMKYLPIICDLNLL